MGKIFKDKVVIVTGSGQGIGRAIALAFAEDGAIVVTNNRKPGGTRLVGNLSEEEYSALPDDRKKAFDDSYRKISGDAETTAQTIIDRGGKALPVYADIAKMGEAERMVKQVTDTYGTVHILINVAGVFGSSPLTEISEEFWDRSTNIKPKGYFNVMKFVIPYMVQQRWGRIINCTSRAMMGDIIRFAQYSSANAGCVGLTQAAACEYYADGITVNAFGPWAKTRAVIERGFVSDEKRKRNAVAGMRAFTTADETPEAESIPPFLKYLCTDDAKDITGTVFTVAGNEVSLHQYPLIAKSIMKFGAEHWTLDELRAQVPRSLLKGYQNIVEVQ